MNMMTNKMMFTNEYDDASQMHLPIPDLSLVTARIDNEGIEVL